MCSDGVLLSSYVDNEVGPGGALRVERHIAECRACREQLRAYQTVSNALLENCEPDVSAAGDRIWRRLDAARGELRRQASFWTHGVRLPAPVAVALTAGVTLLITSVAMWARANDARFEVPSLGAAAVGAAPVGAAGTLSLPWLEQGAIVIQLPEEPQFIQRGMPTILREAEFSEVSAQSAPPPRTQ